MYLYSSSLETLLIHETLRKKIFWKLHFTFIKICLKYNIEINILYLLYVKTIIENYCIFYLYKIIALICTPRLIFPD